MTEPPAPDVPVPPAADAPLPRVRFTRHEWAGSFGDLGTDLPLLVGMILAAGLDCASVFIVFGALQIATGLIYGLPMPMQPLKAMAALVITQKLAGATLFGAGIAIGGIMLILTLTGALTLIARLIPLPVVRGIQLGLALSLASIALKQYVPDGGASGYAIGAFAFAALVLLRLRPHLPAGLIVVLVGVGSALAFMVDHAQLAAGIGFHLPKPFVPTWSDIGTGLLLLALPQLPLSLSNSVIATHQTARDLFPQRPLTIRGIGLTYSIANLTAPWLSGVPVCHGCGGLAGHYALGARTGGSVVMYGATFLVLGVFFSGALDQVVRLFPLPLLGALLFFEALALAQLVRDQAAQPRALGIVLVTGLLAANLPQGYLIGLAVGCALYYLLRAAGAGEERAI